MNYITQQLKSDTYFSQIALICKKVERHQYKMIGYEGLILVQTLK